MGTNFLLQLPKRKCMETKFLFVCLLFLGGVSVVFVIETLTDLKMSLFYLFAGV